MIDFKLKNKWDIPSQSLPIIFIGAGGIIRNAHIPAYKKSNLKVPKKAYFIKQTWIAKSLTACISYVP